MEEVINLKKNREKEKKISLGFHKMWEGNPLAVGNAILELFLVSQERDKEEKEARKKNKFFN